MNLSSSIARVAPGEHYVARHGAAVVLVCPAGPEHEPFVDQLLALCVEAGMGDPSVVRRAGALVTQNPAESVPAFGILCQTADGVVALLAGQVMVSFTAGQAVETLDGRDASTYVERVLRGEYDELRLVATDAPAADPRSSLTDGVVRGAGLLLLPGSAVETLIGFPPLDAGVADVPEPFLEPESAGSPAPLDHTSAVTPGRPDATFESISLVEEVPAADASEAPQMPVAPEETTPDPGPMVEGIYCSRGHFNSPDSIFCSACGISMVQQTHNRVPGPRPPLGVLVTDEGAVFSLVRDYVVGREPETAPDVLAGKAGPIALDDPKVAMSRIHARVLLDGWEVRVEDASSANGTFVGHGDDEWTRLAPGVPTTIKPGTRIAVGGRTLTFETHQRS